MRAPALRLDGRSAYRVLQLPAYASVVRADLRNGPAMFGGIHRERFMNMHVSVSISTDHAGRAVWDKTLADWKNAKQAFEYYNSTAYDPLYDKLERTAPQPNLSFEIETLDGKIAKYNLFPKDLHAWDNHWSPLFLRKAAAVRDYRLEHRRVAEHLGIDAASAECDRLCDVQCAIEQSLIEMPAPDHSALLWK
jgi:hypothetical protein